MNNIKDKNDEKMSRISILSTLGGIKSPILIKKALYNPVEPKSPEEVKHYLAYI